MHMPKTSVFCGKSFTSCQVDNYAEKFPTNKRHMGVSKNRGGPPKWMVKIMENPIKMDDLGVPLFLETPKLVESNISCYHHPLYIDPMFFFSKVHL